MNIEVESNSVFEAVSRVIFDDDWQLAGYEKLYLQTWFCRLGPMRTDQYERLLIDLQSYCVDGSPSGFLCSLASAHPHFLNWFGIPLVGNEGAQRVIAYLLRKKLYATDAQVAAYVDEAKEHLASLNVADKLQEIVGQPYPKPNGPMHFVISEATSHAYNVYPDLVCHPGSDNLQWYVAGYGHEAGHILTWEMCRDPEVRELCKNDVTKEFAERVAELCGKLLLDACGIECSEAFTECHSWEEYMYEKNPGKPLFDMMISNIQLGSYSNFKDACVKILGEFQ